MNGAEIEEWTSISSGGGGLGFKLDCATVAEKMWASAILRNTVINSPGECKVR